jgi:hypothetical protein
MTAPRSTFLLLLVAACLALLAGPAFAEPVETPPAAPPAGAADEMPDGPPPGATEEMAPAAKAPVVETMQAAPGRLPNTDGPKIPNVIGRLPHETNQALGAWRIRHENVITDRSYVGRIVDQHPDAGSTLAPGEVITLVLGIPTLPSRGHTCVPPIEKLTLEQGVALLRKQGFDIMLRVAESYDGDKGVVLAQAPRPASVAPRGSKVVVVVGKGGLGEPVVMVQPLPAPAYEPMPPADEVMPPMPAPPADEPMPPMPPTPAPPADEPPTPMPAPPADESMPPADEPMPPADEPMPPADEPMPPADEPMPPTPAPPADEPMPPAPVPVPVVPPKPMVVLRVPTLSGPATNESYPRAFGSTFTWQAVGGAKTYEWELQAEAQDGSWSTVTTETIEGTKHRPERMEAGRYRWRVRALADDVEGEWSEFRRLFLY